MRTPTSDQLNPPYIQHKCRRDYQRWFKLQIVRECMVPGASVSLVGRKHNINTNVIFRWRAEYERGELAPGTPQVVVDSFIPVGVIGKDGRAGEGGRAAAAIGDGSSRHGYGKTCPANRSDRT